MLTAALILGLVALNAGVPARGGPCAGQIGQLARREAVSFHEGGDRRSRILVLALHGNTISARPAELRARRLLEDLDSAAAAAGVRLLVPVGIDSPRPGGIGWLEGSGESLVWELVRREVAGGRADSRRIMLAGHGAGGTAALTLASRQPERVAGVAVWSAAPAPLWDAQGQVVGLVGDIAQGLLSVPVYVWSARDDVLLDRPALHHLLSDLERDRRRVPGRRAELLHEQSESGGHGCGDGSPRRGLDFLAALVPRPP